MAASTARYTLTPPPLRPVKRVKPQMDLNRLAERLDKTFGITDGDTVIEVVRTTTQSRIECADMTTDTADALYSQMLDDLATTLKVARERLPDDCTELYHLLFTAANTDAYHRGDQAFDLSGWHAQSKTSARRSLTSVFEKM